MYEASVPHERRVALNDGIAALYETPVDPGQSRLMEILKVRDLAPATLQGWLEERVHYVFDVDYDWKAALYDIKGSSFQYPNMDQMPDPGKGLEAVKGTEKGDSSTVMTNMGGWIYWVLKEGSRRETEKQTPGDGGAKKQINLVAGVRLAGIGDVPITSPRVGLLMIGPGLFPSVETFKTDQRATLNVFRAGTLFHEARHSDGHGKTLAFLHTICPDGHTYAGRAACDFSTNGPYTIGAMIHKALMDTCFREGKCEERGRERLRLAYLDFADRIVKGLVKVKGRTPPEFTATPTDWDDAPEGTR